jgi:two-component system OmpR family response regulator
MRILLVEDDQKVADSVASALQSAGYVVDHTGDGEAAWFKGGTESYSAAILDLGLPGLDGLSVLRRWREEGCDFPVLILTARGSWSERVEGIDAGADDYLPKPFRVEELLARLRAILRRATGQSSPLVSVGRLTLDTRQMRVTVDGRLVHLSPQEYRLVSYLYAQDFERDSNAVEVMVGRVRKKLGSNLISTRRGFGYIIENSDP